MDILLQPDIILCQRSPQHIPPHARLIEDCSNLASSSCTRGYVGAVCVRCVQVFEAVRMGCTLERLEEKVLEWVARYWNDSCAFTICGVVYVCKV